MRQYSVILGILLFLFIIDRALAAPIPVPEDLQTCVDVPRDVVTVLEKRGPGDDELTKLVEHFKQLGVPHASSSSPLPGHEHVQMEEEQASGPAQEPAPSNPNPLVGLSNPLSTEPSPYTPASTGPSSYMSSDYGSDGESGSHVSQAESYPPEWDYWLDQLDQQNHADQQGHVHQPDSPPPPPQQQQQQQNDFAHWHDVVQQPPLLNWQQNSFAHGHGELQPLPLYLQQNVHGQMDNLPMGPSLAAFDEWWNRNYPAHQVFHAYQLDLPPQQTHGIPMGGIASTDPSGHTPAPTVLGWNYGPPGTHGSLPDLPPHWLQQGYAEVHAHQQNPSPPPQGEDGIQMDVDDAQQPSMPQGDDVAPGTQ